MEDLPASEEEQSDGCPPFRITDVYLTDQGSADLPLVQDGGGEEEAFVPCNEEAALQMSQLGLPTCFSSTFRRSGSDSQRKSRRHKRLSNLSSLHGEFSPNLCAAVPLKSSLQESPLDTLQVSEIDAAAAAARVSTDEAIHHADEEVLASYNREFRDPQKVISFSESKLVERANVSNDDQVAHNEGAGSLSCAEMDAAFQAALVSCCGMLAPATDQETRIVTDKLMMTTMDELISMSEMLAGEEAMVSDSGGMVTGEGVTVLNVAEEAASAVSNAQALVSNNWAMAAEELPTDSIAKAVAEDEEAITLNSPMSQLVHELPNEATVATYDFSSCEGINARAMISSENVLVELVETSSQELTLENSQNPSLEISNWMAYWDDFYSSYYFYNTDTLETTWEPPKGFESYTYTPGVEDSKVLQEGAVYGLSNSREPVTEKAIDGGTSQSALAGLSTVKEDSGNGEDLGRTERTVDHNEMDGLLPQKEVAITGDEENVVECASPVAQEPPKKASESTGCDVHVQAALCNVSIPTRRAKKASSLLVRLENQHMKVAAAMIDHSPSVFKYWVQRFHLFSKYDLGVKLDEEGWFSVTPEAIAKHQAARCNRGIIVDAFTGVGGNAIQFALAGHYVVAIDNDPKKIEFAHHNAMVYGVADCIDFVLGDFFTVSSSLQADVIFLSPPWGGPDYLDVKVYDILTMLQPKDGMSLFKVAQTVAPNIILFLPRNVNMSQLADLQKISKFPCSCEVERNFLNGKLKAVTAYYGQFTCMAATHLLD